MFISTNTHLGISWQSLSLKATSYMGYNLSIIQNCVQKPPSWLLLTGGCSAYRKRKVGGRYTEVNVRSCLITLSILIDHILWVIFMNSCIRAHQSWGRIFSHFENKIVPSWERGIWEKHWEHVPSWDRAHSQLVSSLTKNTASENYSKLAVSLKPVIEHSRRQFYKWKIPS
jgi:hypothetical protein